MKVAFNLLSAKAGAGISVYKSLLPVIADLDKQNKYYIFITGEQIDLIDSIPLGLNKVILKYVPSNPYLRVLWEQTIFPFYLFKNHIDILYSPGNITSLFAPCKVFLFIENSNAFAALGKKWSVGERLKLNLIKYLTYLSSKKAKIIRFCSKNSFEIISKRLNIKRDKCIMIPHGLNFSLLDVYKQFNDKPPGYSYIVSISVVTPNKNYEVLINAFKLLKNTYGYEGKLLIIGDLCYVNYYKSLIELVKKNNISDDVIFLGKVNYEQIGYYYKNTDCFVLSSIAETFGITLIEALYYGLNVLASDNSRHRDLFIPFNEIAEEYATYFDPFDSKELSRKIAEKINQKSCNDKARKFVISKYNIVYTAKQLIENFIKVEESL